MFADEMVMSKSRELTRVCAAAKSRVSTLTSTLSNALSWACRVSAAALASTSEYVVKVNDSGLPSAANSSNKRCASSASLS